MLKEVDITNESLRRDQRFAVQGPFSPLLETNVASFARWYARQMLQR